MGMEIDGHCWGLFSLKEYYTKTCALLTKKSQYTHFQDLNYLQPI